MKTKMIAMLLTTLVVAPAIAQDIPGEWTIRAGGPAYDQATALSLDKDNNLFVAGYFQRQVSFGDKKIRANGDTDMFLAKYDQDGHPLWVQQAGSDYNKENVISEFATSLSTDPAGNVVVAGAFRRQAVFGDRKIVSRGKDDIFLAKYSANGELMWVNSAGGRSQDMVQHITVDDFGNIYMTGYFQNETSFGNKDFYAAEYENFFIAKYSSEGQLLWVKDAQQSGSVVGRSVSVFQGELFVAGHFENRLNLGASPVSSIGDKDVFVARFSLEGECRSVSRLGGKGEEKLSDMHVTSDGIYLTGTCQDEPGKGPERHAFVSALSPAADPVWIKKLQGSVSEGRAIRVVAKDQILVSGYFLGNVEIDDHVLEGNAEGNAFLIGLDGQGNATWTASDVPTGWKAFNDIQLTSGFALITGGLNDDPPGAEGFSDRLRASDVYLRKIRLPAELAATSGEESGIKAYPNPNRGQFTLAYTFAKEQTRSEVLISDITGKTVYQNVIENVKVLEVPVSLSYVAKGVYNVRVIASGIEFYKKLLIE